jgi:starch phosphorylase
MKASMKATCPVFNSHRMLQEYTEKYYIPACQRFESLGADEMSHGKALAKWKAHVRKHWPQLRVKRVESDIPSETKVGTANKIWAEIHLGALTPEDVTVELYYGSVNASGDIVEPRVTEMKSESTGDGTCTFARYLTCQSSGMHGFTIRIVPSHPDQVNPFETGLVLWA